MRPIAFLFPARLAALALALATLGWAESSVRAEDSGQPEAYTRVGNPETNVEQLQIALRKFVPTQGEGPTVWLAGAMHVGEPAYYHSLQIFLSNQTVVLYEGVNTDSHPRHLGDAPGEARTETAPTNDPAADAGDAETNAGYSMQTELARSLGLVFQLNAIDYDRTNFFNSDLSIEQIQRVMTQGMRPALPGEHPQEATLSTLLQVMDGSSFLGKVFKVGLEFLSSSPQLQATAKLVLIEAVGQLRGDMSEMQGLPPEWKRLIKVLIEARNAHLLSDLSKELRVVPATASITVLYGAAHMDDMERRLVSELQYRPAGNIWLPAFSVDLARSGISQDEAATMREAIKAQMEQIQAH